MPPEDMRLESGNKQNADRNGMLTDERFIDAFKDNYIRIRQQQDSRRK